MRDECGRLNEGWHQEELWNARLAQVQTIGATLDVCGQRVIGIVEEEKKRRRRRGDKGRGGGGKRRGTE